MQRREFIKRGSLLGGGIIAVGLSPQIFAAEQSSYFEQFNDLLKTMPELKGWQGVAEDIPERLFQWRGNLPADLIGRCLYRNGPGRQALGNQRYSHWFDGDGFVNKFLFTKHGLIHSGRFVQTKKYIEESKAGRFLYNGAGSLIANAKMAKSSEAVNTANTALLAVDNKLWALWEAGNPYTLNSETLETTGQIQLEKRLIGVPFSAHPHADRFGNIWNFGDLGYLGESAIIIYQLDQQGHLKQYKIIPTKTSYIHDFAVTDDYLIFYFPPIVKGNGNTIIDALSWHPEQGGRVMVIDKTNLTVVKQLQLDAGFVFHFGNAWQQGKEIIINACWYENANILLNSMGNIPSLLSAKTLDKSVAVQINIDLLASRVTLNKTPINFEFIQYDQRLSGRPSNLQYGVHVNDHAKHAYYDTIAAINTRSGKLDKFHFGNEYISEEPIFIASGSREGQGYLVNTAFNYAEARTLCYVFDAENIAAGPQAYAELDTCLPLGFHGIVI